MATFGPNEWGMIYWHYQQKITHYGQVGIRDLSSRQYLAENSPVAAALTVLMEPEGESPALLKLEAIQKIIVSLFRFTILTVWH